MLKYSVIIPVYNVENYLPRCLDSLLAQNYADLEILLIDNSCQGWFVSFLSLKVKEIIIWMIGSVIRLLFFPCLKGEKEGKWGGKAYFS